MGRKPHHPKKKVIEALRAHNGVYKATADALGVHRVTVSKYVDKFDLHDLVIECRQSNIDLAESKLIDAIRRGESWAIKFQLNTLGKSRGYTERLELGGIDGQPIMHRVSITRGDAESDPIE